MSDKPFVEFDRRYFGEQVESSKVRPATDAEVLTAKATYAATGECDHSIITDTAGWPYDFRSCFICGKGLGTV